MIYSGCVGLLYKEGCTLEDNFVCFKYYSKKLKRHAEYYKSGRGDYLELFQNSQKGGHIKRDMEVFFGKKFFCIAGG